MRTSGKFTRTLYSTMRNDGHTITTTWQIYFRREPVLVFRFAERFIFPPFCLPDGIILFQQLRGRICIPVVASAPFLFDLRQTVFDDAVPPAEDRAAAFDLVEARPDRLCAGVFNDDSVETVRE